MPFTILWSREQTRGSKWAQITSGMFMDLVDSGACIPAGVIDAFRYGRRGPEATPPVAQGERLALPSLYDPNFMSPVLFIQGNLLSLERRPITLPLHVGRGGLIHVEDPVVVHREVLGGFGSISIDPSSIA